MNKIIYFFILVSLGVTSCSNSFRIPQPVDVKNQSKIPRDFIGYFVSENVKPNESGIYDIRIREDFLTLYNRKSFSGRKDVYFEKNNKSYVVNNNNPCEIFNHYFKNDSVYGLVVSEDDYEFGKSFIIKKVKDIWIFNLKSNDSWSPIFVEINGDLYKPYVLKDDVLSKMNSEDNVITQNLNKEDVIYFMKRKEQFMDSGDSFRKKE